MAAEESTNNEDNLDAFEFDGMSPLEHDAVNMHEIFIALMKAGFEEHQALRLVSYLVEDPGSAGVHIHLDPSMMETDEDEDF